jgi:hypothetical protein
MQAPNLGTPHTEGRALGGCPAAVVQGYVQRGWVFKKRILQSGVKPNILHGGHRG